MRTPKVYTIQSSNTRELIETIYDQDWFTFYWDLDFEFSKKDNPNVDEIIPIASEVEFWFKKPVDFWIRWAIWTKIYLTPFDL